MLFRRSCVLLFIALVAGSIPSQIALGGDPTQVEGAIADTVPDDGWETGDRFIDNLRAVYARDDLQDTAAIVAGRKVTKEDILVQRASLNVRSHAPTLTISEAWAAYLPWLAIYYDRLDRGTAVSWEEAQKDHEENTLTDERWWKPVAEVRGMSFDEYTAAAIHQTRLALTVQREIADHVEELFREGIPEHLLPFLPAEEGDLLLEVLAKRVATEQFLDSQRNIVLIEIVWDELR